MKNWLYGLGSMDLYKILGISKKASSDEIKKAYRDKAKENHPDKEGGDPDKMKKINFAYMILKDAEKRNHYDETGEEVQQDRTFLLFVQLLALLSNANPANIQIWLENQKNAVAVEFERKIEAEQKKVDSFSVLISRVKEKPKDDILRTVILDQIKQLEQKIAAIEKDKQDHIQAMKYFEGYIFEDREEDHVINITIQNIGFDPEGFKGL